MLNETDEQMHQITLEEYFEDTVKPDLFAVSRIFADARKQMTLSEYKAFAMALCNVKWKDKCPDTLYLDKKQVAAAVGIQSDSDHLSVNLNRAIGDMPHHSYLKFSDKDQDIYVNGNFVRTIAFFKNVVRIRLEPDFLGLFGNLDRGYITMWSGDIYKMRSERAIKLYEVLRSNSDTRKNMQEGTISIRFLKELFEIPKDGEGSYMRSEKNGGFNRTSFEQRVIIPILEDLEHTDMIQLVRQPNGQLYEKVKHGNRVIAYKLYWTISMHPAVATAAEKAEIAASIEKDPEVLKVAKDIINGKKTTKKRASTVSEANKSTGWTEMENTKYDFDELEKQLLK